MEHRVAGSTFSGHCKNNRMTNYGQGHIPVPMRKSHRPGKGGYCWWDPGHRDPEQGSPPLLLAHPVAPEAGILTRVGMTMWKKGRSGDALGLDPGLGKAMGMGMEEVGRWGGHRREAAGVCR